MAEKDYLIELADMLTEVEAENEQPSDVVSDMRDTARKVMDLDLNELINFAVYQGYRKDYATRARNYVKHLLDRDRVLSELEAKGV